MTYAIGSGLGLLRVAMSCRIQAAINAKLVKDVYKTSACNRANCSRLHCHFFHDESDRLPMIGYKVQYCVAYKVS